jgi:hypothetical protein
MFDVNARLFRVIPAFFSTLKMGSQPFTNPDFGRKRVCRVAVTPTALRIAESGAYFKLNKIESKPGENHGT